MARRGPMQYDEEEDDEHPTFDTGSISQLRYPGDAYPVRNPADIPEPLAIGLLAAHQRAKEAPSPKLPAKKKTLKKPPAKSKRRR